MALGRAASLLGVLGLAGCPTWPHVSVGPQDMCHLSTFHDGIARGQLIAVQRAEFRSFELSNQPYWFTPITVRLHAVERGDLAGEVRFHVASGEVPTTDSDVFVFSRRTADTGTREPLHWVGVAGVGVVDESVTFLNGEHPSPEALLAELRQVAPSCPFNPVTELRSTGISRPEMNELADGGP